MHVIIAYHRIRLMLFTLLALHFSGFAKNSGEFRFPIRFVVYNARCVNPKYKLAGLVKVALARAKLFW